MRILGIAFTLVLLMSLVGCTLSHRNCRHHHHFVHKCCTKQNVIANQKVTILKKENR